MDLVMTGLSSFSSVSASSHELSVTLSVVSSGVATMVEDSLSISLPVVYNAEDHFTCVAAGVETTLSWLLSASGEGGVTRTCRVLSFESLVNTLSKGLSISDF